MKEFARRTRLIAAAGSSGHVAVCCWSTSVVTVGVRTQLSHNTGNWRVNVFLLLVSWTAPLEDAACFFMFLSSSADSELSTELCLSSLRSYSWQFTLQTLHLQQWELILFVGIVFVWVTVQCVYLWRDTEWSTEQLYLELTTYLTALNIQVGNVAYWWS